MKKLLVMFALLAGITGLSFAGQPKDQPMPSQSAYSHGNPVNASSFTVAGINLWNMPAPGTSAGQNCQTCLTRIILQLTQASTAYILESGTTDFVYLGQGLGANTGAVPNTLSLPEDHLGPVCFQTGNTGAINILPTSGSNPAAVDVEGYVDCGGSRN